MPGGRYKQDRRGGSSLAQGHWLTGKQKYLLPALGSQALGQGEGWKLEGTEGCVFGSSRELGSGEIPKQAEGLPTGTLLGPCFFGLRVGKPRRG